MFDFLSKLLPRRSLTQNNTQTKAQILAQAAQQSLLSESKQKNIEQERQQFLQKISASINNEESLLTLLRTCNFADGRYQAAQHIHTQAYLEKALQIVRKLDKRVAKLMQQRLDDLHDQQNLQLQAAACIQFADHLLSQSILLANQLVELDRQFKQLKNLSAEVQGTFQHKRDALQARMDAQLELQRQLLQLVHELECVKDFSDVDVDQQLADWQRVLQSCGTSPFAAALPRTLLHDAQNKLTQFKQAWQQSQQRVLNTKNNYQSTDALTGHVASAEHELDTEPHEVPQISNNEKLVIVNDPVSEPTLTLKQIEDLTTQLEDALEQGSVQVARQIEKALRDIDTKRNYRQFRLNEDLKERLNTARKQLSNLVSWAKWSGAVSRDELIATAEKLGSLSLSPQEIVDTVSALREQWKQMESQGSAPKDLWLRFDAACKLVYAPAAAHFQAQSELRQENLLKAEALLQQFAIEVEQILNHLSDWKLLRIKVLEMQQAWKKLGHVDRKERARLDKEFDALLSTLKAPLEQRQREEIQAREKMIAEVEALDISQKSSQDQLRSLQQRWQMQASSVPLQRRDEQQLWERFRAACDSVFEKKRQLAESADQQRANNLAAKRSICQQLMDADMDDRETILQTINTATQAWRQLGHVPRAQEQAIEKEFELRLQRLRDAMTRMQSDELQQRVQKIKAGLSLCQKLEAAIAQHGVSSELIASLRAEWQQLELPMNRVTKGIGLRFECAANLSSEDLIRYQDNLRANTSSFDALCLHLEILLGIESKTVTSQERLKKQVEVLQSALKSADNQAQQHNLLMQLLSMPVSQDDTRQQRLLHVMSTVDPRHLVA